MKTEEDDFQMQHPVGNSILKKVELLKLELKNALKREESFVKHRTPVSTFVVSERPDSPETDS